ncbi:MAG: S41 family peptidase, partial [Trueperaceae bacterium]
MNLLSRLALALVLTAGWVSAASQPRDMHDDRERVFDAVVDVFERNYWDATYLDWQEWAAPYRSDALSARSREAFDRVLGRMIGEVGDDHSSWLGLVAYARNEDIPGVGPSRLGIRATLLNGTGLVVERVFPGTAAALAGLRRGDVIVRVDGRELNRLESRYRVWELLREAADRQIVSLELLRGRSRVGTTLAPAPFELALAEQLPQAEMLDERLGYLYVPSFNRDDIASEVHRLLRELQGQGLAELVIDLRGNPGGRIGELGLTLGAFLDGTWARAVSRGEVVWHGRYAVEGRRGATWLEDPRGEALLTRYVDAPTVFSGPLAVLVDRRNSSAGEIAALVLQAQGRALVVGEPTHGNVEAVRGFDLPDGSVVMVAVANLEAPDGQSFSAGVVPDSVARESLRELAFGYDAPLSEAIRLLRGLPFTPNRYFGQSAT